MRRVLPLSCACNYYNEGSYVWVDVELLSRVDFVGKLLVLLQYDCFILITVNTFFI